MLQDNLETEISGLKESHGDIERAKSADGKTLVKIIKVSLANGCAFFVIC